MSSALGLDYRAYLPRHYYTGRPASVRVFYDLLRAYFEKAGVPHRFPGRWQRPWMHPGRARVLTYHSHSQAPLPHRLHVKVDYVTSFFTLDDLGYSGWSSLIGHEVDPNQRAQHIAQGRAVVSEYAAVGTKIPSNDPAHDQVPPPGSVIVYGQLTDDAVAVFHSDWKQMFDKAEAVAAALGVDVFFKPHPKEKGPLRKLVAKDFPHLKTYSGPLAPCLEGRVQFVQNSGVGYEALLKGAPVVSFGGSDYARFTVDGRQPLDQVLAGIEAWSPEDALAGVGFLQENRVCVNWPEDVFTAKLDAILQSKFGPHAPGTV